jgi:hypothetical protein
MLTGGIGGPKRVIALQRGDDTLSAILLLAERINESDDFLCLWAAMCLLLSSMLWPKIDLKQSECAGQPVARLRYSA